MKGYITHKETLRRPPAFHSATAPELEAASRSPLGETNADGCKGTWRITGYRCRCFDESSLTSMLNSTPLYCRSPPTLGSRVRDRNLYCKPEDGWLSIGNDGLGRVQIVVNVMLKSECRERYAGWKDDDGDQVVAASLNYTQRNATFAAA